jgi:hypothetical protein
VPLIGPLEDGLLLVPVYVGGAGPYVFALDPDANVSIVDETVVRQAKLRVGEGPHLLDESDTTHPHFYAEIIGMEVGSLSVERKSALVVKDGTFNSDGRVIDGVIGRDVIADSLVFGFDRDQGVALLSTHKAWKGFGGALGIKYERAASTIQTGEVAPPPRRLVTASVNGQTFALHIDLGAELSQLRERSWPKANITATDAQVRTVDETGFVRQQAKAGTADVDISRTAASKGVVFVPYADSRWPDEDLEGTLGLDYFRPYSVAIDWDQDRMFVRDRQDVAAATRIGRWQSKTLSECKHVGCATVSIVDPVANMPKEQRPAVHPGVIASFVREDSAAGLLLEVTVAANGADGKPLPWLVANLQGTADRAMIHLGPEYAGATLAVVDASEFPRSCPNNAASCIDRLAAPRGAKATPPTAPATPPPATPPPPEPPPAAPPLTTPPNPPDATTPAP